MERERERASADYFGGWMSGEQEGRRHCLADGKDFFLGMFGWRRVVNK